MERAFAGAIRVLAIGAGVVEAVAVASVAVLADLRGVMGVAHVVSLLLGRVVRLSSPGRASGLGWDVSP